VVVRVLDRTAPPHCFRPVVQGPPIDGGGQPFHLNVSCPDGCGHDIHGSSHLAHFRSRFTGNPLFSCHRIDFGLEMGGQHRGESFC